MLRRHMCHFSVNKNSVEVTKGKYEIFNAKDNSRGKYTAKPQDHNLQGVAKITRVEHTKLDVNLKKNARDKLLTEIILCVANKI